MNASTAPIGVFDSGIGGISVLHCLKKALPMESFIYLGDMARVPYGTKSKETVVRYTIESARKLLEKNIKLLVIACNTATALALLEVQAAIGIPVIGMISHSAEKACQQTKNGHIALIATEGTVNSGSYERYIHQISPKTRFSAKSGGLLVALVEEGFLDHPVTEMVVREYLDPFFTMPNAPDCLILGCTHYPFLLLVIERVVNDRMLIINPAEETAEEAKRWLLNHAMNNTDPAYAGHVEYWVSDAKSRFLRLAQLFLGEVIPEDRVIAFEV